MIGKDVCSRSWEILPTYSPSYQEHYLLKVHSSAPSQELSLLKVLAPPQGPMANTHMELQRIGHLA